jgi:hypothetical protein
MTGQLAPGQVRPPAGPRRRRRIAGDLQQPFRGVGPAVQDHVLDALQQLGGISEYTASWPGLTMPMSMPAAMAW